MTTRDLVLSALFAALIVALGPISGTISVTGLARRPRAAWASRRAAACPAISGTKRSTSATAVLDGPHQAAAAGLRLLALVLAALAVTLTTQASDLLDALERATWGRRARSCAPVARTSPSPASAAPARTGSEPVSTCASSLWSWRRSPSR
jgi:energy-coupling factor transporter transmembrane protein EcfT